MGNQTHKRIPHNLPEEQTCILQHQAWPRTPCPLTNSLEGFDSSGGWSQLHHWQWHYYTITQLCFLDSARCIYSPVFSPTCGAADFSNEQVWWQAWGESAFLHFDTDPNSKDIPWREKKSFPLYRIYLSNSFKINDALQPWVSTLEWCREAVIIPQVSEKASQPGSCSSRSCSGTLAQTQWYLRKNCHLFN